MCNSVKKVLKRGQWLIVATNESENVKKSKTLRRTKYHFDLNIAVTNNLFYLLDKLSLTYTLHLPPSYFTMLSHNRKKKKVFMCEYIVNLRLSHVDLSLHDLMMSKNKIKEKSSLIYLKVSSH